MRIGLDIFPIHSRPEDRDGNGRALFSIRFGGAKNIANRPELNPIRFQAAA